MPKRPALAAAALLLAAGFAARLVVRAQPIVTAAGLWIPVYDQERDRSTIFILKVAGGSAPVSTRSGGKQQ
ncbi:MAG: hypothetical protein NTZ26_14355 [Candidatus Aminicenantes bacterium]|nr:hypothetical protein [Candidatus Aminicenantes bacterium]